MIAFDLDEPENCEECRFSCRIGKEKGVDMEYHDYCCANGNCVDAYYNKRPKWCPIIIKEDEY